ncbi:MAG TPA: D-alanyl-D-alanine carboxypeptidase/D-alanyl-D-alanine-endopeptidase, partial [Armatimonadota bacterium]|nr:D-alanyl-D-alanine carboxypeptidase/D-alanyl-D-alanine-endopeptidase [Armatimonadota bacterium]
MRHRRLWLTIHVLMIAAATAASAAPVDIGDLRAQLDAVFDHEDLASTSTGILIVWTETGEVLYERTPDRALMPASNQKLLTTLGALEFLGPNFTYTTRVLSNGEVSEQGWLDGDLWVLGAGDPTLTRDDLDDLASQVSDHGITRISGSIVVDASCFPGPPLGRGWPWNDESSGYQAQVSGLAVDSNVVRVEVTGGAKPGDPCALELEPESDYLTLDPECTTGEDGDDRPSVYRRRAQNVLATTGPVPPGVTVSGRVTLEDPALHLGTLFARSLVEKRIRADGSCAHGLAPADATELATRESAPLTDILVALNVPSNNNIAEALLRTIPIPAGKPGTAGEGMSMVADHLTEIGVDTGPLRLCDGSGLSRLNLV